MARTEFNDDAHPDATDITGNREYGPWGQCVAHSKSADRRCRQPAKGSHGKCRTHGGETENDKNDKRGRGDQEGNDNRATHELYSASNTYYQRRSDAAQELIDDIYADYYDRYTARHGEHVPAGDEAMLFKVAVNIHKQLKADEWEATKPDSLDSKHPLIDRTEKVDPQGEHYFEYDVTAVDQAEHRLATRTRQWLKDNNLNAPSDDGADVEVNISERMWDDLTDYYDSGSE